MILQCNANPQIKGSWLGYTFLAVLNNAFGSPCKVFFCGHYTWPKQLQGFTQHQGCDVIMDLCLDYEDEHDAGLAQAS